MSEDERATEAVLAFLRDTRVGCMASLAPPEEESEEGEAQAHSDRTGRGGSARPGLGCTFLMSFLCLSLVRITFFGEFRNGGDLGALL